jgi:PilZ domain
LWGYRTNAASRSGKLMTEIDLTRTTVERRREARRSEQQRGVIKFGPSGQYLPCTVHDLTSEGAGLSVGRTFGLPEVFRLAINGEREDRYCKLVWVDGKRLGVSFE